MTNLTSDVLVEPITDASDFGRLFDITAASFGRQISDQVWLALNPNWETPSGRATGIEGLRKRWETATRNDAGDLNTVFLKATVPSNPDSDSGRAIAGMAIWQQASVVPGKGDPPVTDLSKVVDLEQKHPGDEASQRYLVQVDRSLHARRISLVDEIAADADSPALFVLDMCCVDPAFQRRGVARRLTEWGFAEARRRGGLELTTEASTNGRKVYAQCGFVQEGGEIEFVGDEDVKGRGIPSNVFMRTGRPGRN